jgi:hypothetical protein
MAGLHLFDVSIILPDKRTFVSPLRARESVYAQSIPLADKSFDVCFFIRFALERRSTPGGSGREFGLAYQAKHGCALIPREFYHNGDIFQRVNFEYTSIWMPSNGVCTRQGISPHQSQEHMPHETSSEIPPHPASALRNGFFNTRSLLS